MSAPTRRRSKGKSARVARTASPCSTSRSTLACCTDSSWCHGNLGSCFAVLSSTCSAWPSGVFWNSWGLRFVLYSCQPSKMTVIPVVKQVCSACMWAAAVWLVHAGTLRQAVSQSHLSSPHPASCSMHASWHHVVRYASNPCCARLSD